MIDDFFLGGGDAAGGNENGLQVRLDVPLLIEITFVLLAADRRRLASHPELAEGHLASIRPTLADVRVDVEVGPLSWDFNGVMVFFLNRRAFPS
jgi:hypothetical protein